MRTFHRQFEAMDVLISPHTAGWVNITSPSGIFAMMASKKVIDIDMKLSVPYGTTI